MTRRCSVILRPAVTHLVSSSFIRFTSAINGLVKSRNVSTEMASRQPDAPGEGVGAHGNIPVASPKGYRSHRDRWKEQAGMDSEALAQMEKCAPTAARPVELSVVVPTFNESENVPLLIA